LDGDFLEHDPEKWDWFSLATNAGGVCAEIMLKQQDGTTSMIQPG